MTRIHQLIIIGSGPAGLTAAIYAARSNLSPVVIEGDKPGGQLMGTSLVENWPGEKAILGPTLMSNMRQHAEQLKTQFVPGNVTKIDTSKRPFNLLTSNNTSLQAHALIIATGSSPNRLGVPGEDRYWGKGVTTCAVCDGPLYRNKKVVIVGGGDTAMEDASFLSSFTQDITIIQNLDKLTASHAMQQKAINNQNINIVYNSTVTEFIGDNSSVQEIVITDLKTKLTSKKSVDGVFIAIGLTPNTAPFKGQIECNKWGYITLRERTQTSVDGIFAAGDVTDWRYKQAITSAGQGCKAALDAQSYLSKFQKK